MYKKTMFDIFLLQKTLTNLSDSLCHQALQYCLDYWQHYPGRQISNRGGWQSYDFVLKDFKGTPLAEIFDTINESLIVGYRDFWPTGPNDIHNIWINVNPKDAFNAWHVHVHSMLSGVFYLSTDNSPIEFQCPIVGMNGNYIHQPQHKELLVFPASIMHMVHRNSSQAPRVSLAFNILSSNRKFNLGQNISFG